MIGYSGSHNLWSYLQRLALIRASSSIDQFDKESSPSTVRIFAIDTNILETIVQDSESSLCILPDDDLAQSLYVKSKFFDFLFSETLSDQPIYVLPGHDKEAVNFYDSLILYWEQTEVEKEELLSEIGGLNEQTNTGYLAQRLLELILRRDLISSVSRAIKSGKLVSLSSAMPKNGSVLERAIANTNWPNRRSKYYFDEQRLRRKWVRKFQEGSHKLSHQKLKEREKTWGADADALARLETVNHRLDSYDYRIVLLTLDKFVKDVCDTETDVSFSSILDFSFADLCVRSPLSIFETTPTLLEESNWDTAGEDKNGVLKVVPGTLTQIIDFFLAPLIGNGWSNKRLEMVTEADTDEAFFLAQTVRKSISDNVSRDRQLRSSINHLINKNYPKEISDFMSRHKELRSDGKDEVGIEELVEYFEKKILEYENDFDDLVSSAMSFGVYFAKQMEQRLGRFRRMPALYFDSLPMATEFVRSIQGESGESIDFQKISKDIESLEHEDPSGYSKYLSIGLVFGSVGLYRVAMSCATRALAIADELKVDARSKISGREAAFFVAFLQRILASKKKDIKKSRNMLLERYPIALARDKSRFADGGIKGARAIELLAIRTQVEDFASLSHMYHFNVLKGSGAYEQHPFRIGAILDDMIDFQNDMEMNLDNHLENSWIFEKCVRANRVNIMAILLLYFEVSRRDIGLFQQFIEGVEKPLRSIAYSLVSGASSTEYVLKEPILFQMAYVVALTIERKGIGEGRERERERVLLHLKGLLSYEDAGASFAPFEADRLRDFNRNVNSFIDAWADVWAPRKSTS